MKHLLFAALSAVALTACGGRVVVDGDLNREGAGGEAAAGGGSGAHPGDTTVATTSGPIATTVTGAGATTGSGVPSGDCEMVCGPNDGSTCSCVKTCAPPGGFTKVACAPNENGEIRCVCTLESGNFSSICFEINNAACDFDFGCCAKYISGK